MQRVLIAPCKQKLKDQDQLQAEVVCCVLQCYCSVRLIAGREVDYRFRRIKALQDLLLSSVQTQLS